MAVTYLLQNSVTGAGKRQPGAHLLGGQPFQNTGAVVCQHLVHLDTGDRSITVVGGRVLARRTAVSTQGLMTGYGEQEAHKETSLWHTGAAAAVPGPRDQASRNVGTADKGAQLRESFCDPSPGAPRQGTQGRPSLLSLP